MDTVLMGVTSSRGHTGAPNGLQVIDFHLQGQSIMEKVIN